MKTNKIVYALLICIVSSPLYFCSDSIIGIPEKAGNIDEVIRTRPQDLVALSAIFIENEQEISRLVLH